MKEATIPVTSSVLSCLRCLGKGWVFLPDPVSDRRRVESALFPYGETRNRPLICEIVDRILRNAENFCQFLDLKNARARL